ncbi:threonine-phosphate decarboxylase CobD [Alkalihalophilus lindianensis]|uniref:threonine-phosphate decarboxylase n=1 Tax=Alkalihalophilus lindianensis TaxID=1630542 RepID=A0ABU3X684_9BACI|nr:threonine-phosphate decarboxylase CobD [Alkalihalophilus lindianensis]MDV2683401.1 threonine-phosphate decarboxylase CobD [Alkalihalophilus lindianensis]
MSLPNHGANPKHLTKALGLTYEEDSIDFSVNTNPLGVTQAASLQIDQLQSAIQHYPEPYAETLSRALSEKLNVNDNEVIVGNGAAELIFHLAHLYQGKRVLIVEPTFSEYRDACHANHCYIDSLVLHEPWKLSITDLEGRLESFDLLFICSPNNPTGTSYSINEMKVIIECAKRNGTKVVIDEAFYDFQLSKQSILNQGVDLNDIIILRSMTKMYGIAGVRLGYLMADKVTISKIKQFQPPWSVNGLAQKIGLQILNDEPFVEMSTKYLAKERRRVKKELEQIGFCISDSVVNFYLLSEPAKQDLQPLLEFLIQHGVIPRHTYSFNGLDGAYIRLAVKKEEENNQLLDVLRMWREKC